MGASIHAVDIMEATPLHYASARGSLYGMWKFFNSLQIAISFLASVGANVNERDAEGIAVINVTIFRQHAIHFGHQNETIGILWRIDGLFCRH